MLQSYPLKLILVLKIVKLAEIGKTCILCLNRQLKLWIIWKKKNDIIMYQFSNDIFKYPQQNLVYGLYCLSLAWAWVYRCYWIYVYVCMYNQANEGGNIMEGGVACCIYTASKQRAW